MIDQKGMARFQEVVSQWHSLLGEELYYFEGYKEHCQQEKAERESLPFLEQYPPTGDFLMTLYGSKEAINASNAKSRIAFVKRKQDIRFISFKIAVLVDEIIGRECFVFFDLVRAFEFGSGETADPPSLFEKCKYLIQVAINKLNAEYSPGASKAEIKKNANYERDLFMYNLAVKGELWKEIRTLVHKRFEGYWLDSDSAAQKAVKRFITTQKLPDLHPRKRG